MPARAVSVLEALAGPRLVRVGIPAELEQLGEMMGAAGISCSQINRVLQINAQKRGVPVTWTYHDVWHRFGPSTEELRLGAENLSKWTRVHMRQEDHVLPGAVRVINCRFSGSWFIFDGAAKAYGAMRDRRSIFNYLNI